MSTPQAGPGDDVTADPLGPALTGAGTETLAKTPHWT
jgi:hypothetical protein